MNGTAFYARFIKCGSAKKGSWRFVRITKGDLWVSIWPSIVVGACLGCDLTLKRRSMLGELAPQVTPTAYGRNRNSELPPCHHSLSRIHSSLVLFRGGRADDSKSR